MRQHLLAGNWKMNGSQASIVALLTKIAQGTSSQQNELEIIVFPPAVFLQQVAKILQQTVIAWGAQDVSANELGAYTGEIAAQMLLDVGCRYVLVGHSERRALQHEDNALVALKFAQAKHYDLRPILCVGETLGQRQAGQTKAVIIEQIEAVLALRAGVEGFREAVIAYEPVWAIGTGMSATPEQAQAIHSLIRNTIAQSDPAIAECLPIIYGGSVKASNAEQLFAMADIDGGLVGGASLDGDEFVEIIRCIN